MSFKLRGPLEHCPQKPNPNNFDDPGYENILPKNAQIFHKFFGQNIFLQNFCSFSLFEKGVTYFRSKMSMQ